MNTVSALADSTSAKAPPGRRRRPPSFARHTRVAARPKAVTRRTTLTFDSAGLVRVGRIPKHGRAVTEFADLTQRSAPSARVGNRMLSAADLIAVVADKVIGEDLAEQLDPEVGIAVTYPARYSDEHVEELRDALDELGLTEVELVAEPVAAAHWLESERSSMMPGLTLVYDLGGGGLDVTLVRVGPGSPPDPIVGESLRSTEFGGRAYGAMVARARRGPGQIAGTEPVPTPEELRTRHIRGSLELVYRCLRSADVTMADVDCVLVVGGAARPAEVVEVLATELARPVMAAPDPERTIADGAALIARRNAVEESEGPVRDADDESDAQGGVGRAAGFSRRTRQRFTRVASAAGLSAIAAALMLGLPGDGVIVELPQLGQ
ncbi:Hsp70 family protein [Nocardia callitridis]|uniref:Hsp70 family protein n=1 Tax=Nocardia callitridis TaxID=648753 RepID=UPI0031EE9719